jgi:hypothetical protein
MKINMTYAPIVVTHQKEWNKYIAKSFDYAIYHTYDYHALDKNGTPLLFVFQHENDFIAFPLLKRQIEDSSLFDLTSVYGYSGPFSNKKLEDIDAQTKEDFAVCFNNFLIDQKCICVFARLNPFFNQTKLLNKMGCVKSNGKTIYIDLSISLETQRENYHKRLARQIKQLRKRNYFIKEANTQQEIKLFTEMYTENMDRLSASESYYFDEAYFTKMLKNSALKSKLILVYDGDIAICGALIICSKNIIRNHLSATNAIYIKESPSKLLTDEISIIGRKMGAKYFHLGGGLRGQNDTLFTFKSYFSNLFLEDYIWCYIADNENYQAIVNEKDISFDDGFFPLYRSFQANKSLHMAEI